jgi:glycosyltransferase involved in cell wall biosynthesis
MKHNILRVTAFSPHLLGHGGERRTAQIDDLLKLAGFDVSDAELKKSTRFKRYARGMNIWARSNFRHIKNTATIEKWGHSYLSYQDAFKQHLGSKLVLWELTRDYMVPYVARDNKFKIITIPQNIESLVLGACDLFTGDTIPKSFENEILHLAMSDAIFCISREEQWLLNSWGIEADFLPYYPVKQIFDELLDVRESRVCSEKLRFLILGSASNPPTRQGMIEQIQILEKIRKDFDFEVDIVGYGTECLREHTIHSNINLIGPVSSSHLHDLMKGAIALLVHQKAGIGALTRIPEMLIAGIPVIANANACRSAYTYQGVYCYDTASELLELLKKPLDLPEILPRPLMAEKCFIDKLKAINTLC